MEKIESKIISVTVYSDRAQVCRSASFKLDDGEQIVCFDNLPENVEQKSIRVTGNGKAVLRDISFKTINFAEPQNDAVKKMLEQKNVLHEKLDKQRALSELADLERNFLDKITEKLTAPEKKQKSGELNPDSWIKMIDFYRNKLELLEEQKSKSGKLSRLLNDELEKIDEDLALLNTGRDRIRNQVEVTLEMKESDSIELELSYMVYGPCWYPVYDLRVSTEDKQMNITYNAMVSQATSEDWNDVHLKLSTAQPQVDGTIPKLYPWHINMYSPKQLYSKAAAPMRMKKTIMGESEVCEEPGEMMKASMSIAPPESIVETQATSVVFAPAGTNTIVSDNTPYRVTVLIKDFPAEFRYESVPKLSPYTYLKAKVKNNSEYPLLAGDSNIFMDNNFVANAYLKTVAPEEEFWTSLGIDEGIKVERKFIRKYEKEEGLISKKTKFIYEYRLIIENKRKTSEDLILQEQIPITGHQDITVELIAPKINKESSSLKLTDENIIEWQLLPDAGEKIEFPFSFSIDYPRNSQVAGLD
ncbi:MAG: mucoidy inhibitor MuiA family protein [Spirochaetales bacterium]|nr:mucoidy inhibitor MuiA family protein [Spirochaetales bacterium]